MSVNAIRGGRGRGRGGYRPIRRPVTVEVNSNDENVPEQKIASNVVPSSKLRVSPPPVPVAQQTLSVQNLPRKPLNIFNVTSYSHITQVETCKLMEQLKVFSNKVNKNDDDDNDERVVEEKPRCEFCARMDHQTRNCSLFKAPPNACYICKEIGHYKNQCPRRQERGKLSSYRGQSFRSGVKAYCSRSGTSLKWNTSSAIQDASEDDGDSTTANSNSVGGKPAAKPARISVPMPVPASSIKPTIQLRSKLKSNESTSIKSTPAVKSQSKTSSYIRSDTEDDEFSTSSSADEKDVTASTVNACSGADNAKKTSQIKDKFDLSVVNQMVRTPITPSEFAKQFMTDKRKPPPPLRDLIKEAIQPLIPEATKVETNPEPLLEEVKEDVASKPVESDPVESGNGNHYEEIEFCDNEILSDVDENSNQTNPDLEYYGCDGAILSENDSEAQEKSDRDKIIANSDDSSETNDE